MFPANSAISKCNLDVSRRPRSDLIWINTRAFAIRLHLHARVNVERWASDAAIFLYDTRTGTGRG
jgi:hypothetical protein